MDIFKILFSDQLENLDGFRFDGVVRIPRKLVAEAVLAELKNPEARQSSAKNSQEKEDFSVLSRSAVSKLIEHLEIREMNVFFEDGFICFRIDAER